MSRFLASSSRSHVLTALVVATAILSGACVEAEEEPEVSTTEENLDIGDVTGAFGLDSCNIYAAVPGWSTAVNVVEALHLPSLDICYELAAQGAAALSASVPAWLSNDVLDCVCERAFAPDATPALPSWQSWQQTGQFTNQSPSLVLLPDSPAEVYYRGPGGTLQEMWWTSSGWATYNLGDQITNSPSAVGTPGHRWVFFRNYAGDVILREYNGTWLPPRNLGMNGTGAPGAVAAFNEVYVFARDTNNNLVMKRTDNGVWRGYAIIVESFSSTDVASAVTAIPYHTGYGFTLYYRGTGGDLRRRLLYGNEWQWRTLPGSMSLGGQLTNAPGVVKLASGETDIYVTGLDKHIWQKAETYQGWMPSSDGFIQHAEGLIVSTPSVASVSMVHRMIVGTGLDGQIWFRVWI